MDAYEAYHNSKDNALLLSQTRSEELAKEKVPDEKPDNKAATTALKPDEKKTAKEGTKKVSDEVKKTDGDKSPTTVTTNNYTTVM